MRENIFTERVREEMLTPCTLTDSTRTPAAATIVVVTGLQFFVSGGQTFIGPLQLHLKQED